MIEWIRIARWKSWLARRWWIAGLSIVLTSGTAGQTIAIRAGNLIEPQNGSVLKNQIIVIKDKKIVAKGSDVAIPAGAQMIDLSQSWVMPGIMDAHTHVTFGAASWRELDHDYLKEGTGIRTLLGLRNAQTLLRAGITTLRDTGNDGNYAAVDLRKAIEADWFPGPTILAAGKIIAPFGGQNAGIPQELGPVWQFEYRDADGPAEIRRAVRKNIYYGVDLIKLVADSNDYYYSVDEVRAAVDEAHRANRAVAVHVLGGEAAQNVILAGPDSIEHGDNLTDEQLRLMKEKGIVLVGTDFPSPHFELADYPNAKEAAAAIQDRLRRAYKIGVKMGFGTDIMIDLPNETRADMTWDYLAVWRAAGVPPAIILKSMTTNNAELFRIAKERGAIETGYFADIIAMPENPLADIEALRKINFVVKNGVIVRKPQ